MLSRKAKSVLIEPVIAADRYWFLSRISTLRHDKKQVTPLVNHSIVDEKRS